MTAAPRLLSAENSWVDGWSGPVVFEIGRPGLTVVDGVDPSDRRIVGHVPGTLMPGFTDSHVHLGLVDASALVANGIARVVDLGLSPGEAAAARDRGSRAASAVRVEFAGAILTAPGGYPTASAWAPAGWSREVATAADAATAVAEMRRAGADRIKIALNSAAGPVWGDDVLSAVVAAARMAGMPVVAHAEGAGEAARAARHGVAALAHTPFSERLADEELRRMAGSIAWISTLDIHGWGRRTAQFSVAVDNLARFAALGGRVVYGTDLGNGPLPTGLNRRELAALFEAGLSLDRVVAALTPTPLAREDRFSWAPALPAGADPAAWLATATVVAIDALEERFA